MRIEEFDKLRYTDEEIDNELLSAIIKAGAHEYIKNAISMPTEEELSEVSFSEAFEKRMQAQFNMFEKEEKRERKTNLFRKIRKVAVNVAAGLFVVITLSSIFVKTSEAAQINFLNALIEAFNIKTNFRFTDSDYSESSETSLSSMLGYIPVGLEIANELNYETFEEIQYISDIGLFMYLRKQESGSVTIDSENTETYKLLIGEYNCYVSEKEDETIVVFEDDFYAYTIESNLSMDEITEIIYKFK